MALSDQTFFHNYLLALYLIAPPTFISLRFLRAPYGKPHRVPSPRLVPHGKPNSLAHPPPLPLRPPLVQPKSPFAHYPFLFHYFHRTILYSLRLHRNTASSKSSAVGFPVSVVAIAFGFNMLNAYLQARWVPQYKGYESDGWFWWRFVVGLAVFGYGMDVNICSDRVLVGLKKEGGGIKCLSCPNYYGEIMEWVGWEKDPRWIRIS